MDVTAAWVTQEREELHRRLAEMYEQKSYEELQALPGMQYRAPTGGDVDKTRGRRRADGAMTITEELEQLVDAVEGGAVWRRRRR